MQSRSNNRCDEFVVFAVTLLVFGVLGGDVEAQDPAPPRFVDVTEEKASGLANARACWADVNGDGWVDLCAGVIWLNKEGKSFEKTSDGYGGVIAADIDNDGDVDLFSWSSLSCLKNDGKGRFEAIEMPELPRCVSLGASFADFNNDGYVDIYVGGYEDWNAGLTFPDLLLLNQAGERFELAWQDGNHRARGVTSCDFDRDGDADVYVSNYRLQPNQLWVNDGQAALEDQAEKRGVLATSEGFQGGHSIGSAWGDFDNDGRFDLFAGNFAHVDGRGDQPKSRFLRQVGSRDELGFEDMGPCGVHYQESYATPALADFDNDGDLDLFFTTVYGTASFGRPNSPVLFRNDRDFSFADDTEGQGLPKLPPTYQAAWADFDRDGDLDLVSGGRLFENRTEGQSWLRVRLEGSENEVNRSAIGAQVRLQVAGQTMVRQVEAGTGEGNQNEAVLHFGLAGNEGPVTIEVLWPGGETQMVKDVPLNDEVHVVHGRE